MKKQKNLTGVSTELTTRLKYQINLLMENKTKNIDNFVDNEFLALDAREYRKFVQSITPDMDLTVDYTTGNGNTIKVGVPLGLDFCQPPRIGRQSTKNSST